MFNLSSVFVASLLATVAYASPALETRSGPPEQNGACRPSGLSGTTQFQFKSAANGFKTKVWEATSVDSTSFSGVGLQPKSSASAAQRWTIHSINHGDSFAFVSAAITSSNQCINGDGGPLGHNTCPDVATRVAPQFAQWFIFCRTCDSAGQGATGCQIQSAGEGQCASFLDGTNGDTIKLDDCSSKQRHQFWDIIPAA